MFYYEIVLGARTRSTADFYTYTSTEDISIGSFVTVDFRSKPITGIIVKKVTEPEFETKPIATVLPIPSLPETQLKLMSELIGAHPYSSPAIAQLFTPPSGKIYAEQLKKQQKTMKPARLPALNEEQQKALLAITATSGNVMLFGETGSGKTRIYLHAADAVLKQGKSVVILAPEIGLSSFIYKQVKEFYPNTHLYHSTLTKKQRQIIWQSCILGNEPVIIVGPRSALTLPIKNIGLIITDEAHDTSYKQDNSPFIRTHEVCVKLADITSSTYIYATATPNSADYYYASLKQIPVIRLTGSAANPESLYGHNVRLIPYDDNAEFSSNSLISLSALNSIKASIKNGTQALILLNKRGTAHHIHCTSCTWELTCPTCDRGLVYHRDTHLAHCHTCDKKVKMPAHCPDCSQDITLSSPGTKAIADLLSNLIPGVSLARFDTDTEKSEDIHARLAELQSGMINCIVGTQMIAKGLDLPLLETVVVLHAEGSSGGDYAAEERAFQLIHQVIGRGTRGHRNTTIFLQSRNPSHPTLSYALNRDVSGFISYDLTQRKNFGYPPFCFMAVIHYKKSSSASAQKAGQEFITKYSELFPALHFSYPLPNVRERQGPMYHWHILARSSRKDTLLALAKKAGSTWSFDLDPISTP